MAEATLLRWHEVRDAYRLIGECRDLGAEPVLWQRRLLEGLVPLLDAAAVTSGEGFIEPPQRDAAEPMAYSAHRPTLTLCAGELTEQLYLTWMRQVGPNACPLFDALKKRTAPIVTCARTELLSDRQWYRSVSFQIRDGIFDHQLTSIAVRTRSALVISLHRTPRSVDFSERQRQLLHFIQGELALLVGHALSSSTESEPLGLSPRLRQTLACLLEGDSEKQIASRLRLSSATAHQYVTALYRHFGVRSRGQLLAHALTRASKKPWATLMNGVGAN
jgi:DNA-binding CsgD family transcriptional regulator